MLDEVTEVTVAVMLSLDVVDEHALVSREPYL